MSAIYIEMVKPIKEGVEDGFSGIKKTTKVKPLNVIKEKPKLERHKYKCDVGKKSFTCKNKKELSQNLGLTRTATNKLLNGELNNDKIKIHFI